MNHEQSRPDPERPRSTFQSVQFQATEALIQFKEVSKRPVRHNRRIERAALWHVLRLNRECVQVLDSYGRPDLVRPKTGDVVSRYEAEAAIRTVPSLLPFSRSETTIMQKCNLGNGRDLSNYQFEYGIGDTTRGQLGLCERWHDWLWTDGSGRAQDRSIESQVMEIACARLSVALYDVITSRHSELYDST
jgi:hypothetical protein